MRGRFPPLEPYRTGRLPVGGGHTLYYEESGNPEGKPIVFLHGGPGSGTQPSHRTFFNPAVYRIILFDQRGCGKSVPYAELEENTTWDLVADLERLRAALHIDRWVVFGGSWGSTLALAYAESHPERVKGLILRGIFLAREKELRWFYQSGAHQIFPEQWEVFIAEIPPEERGDLMGAYYRRLTSSDAAVRRRAAIAWAGWVGAALRLHYDPALFQEFTEPHKAVAIARIECHYFVHRAFFNTDNWLIEQAHRIAHLPTVIVHGRYDMICPFETAWELHRALPNARLEVIPDAGHAASEPGIADALLRATGEFESY
jgi:proline iminopeptidase